MVDRYTKLVESPLRVFRTIDGKPVVVGDMRFVDDGPRSFHAEFRYRQSYVDNPKAYALDPINLPLANATRVFATSSRYQVLGALFDAAPDAWGRKVINATEGVSQNTEQAVLLKGRGMGVGEIYFADGDLTDVPPAPPVPHMDEIALLSDPIRHIDEGEEFNPLWEDLLVSSWDIGGARPKAVVQDSSGALWIAKFPKKGESYDRQRVEWANLEMAHDIGMDVPPHRLVETAQGAVLLIKRFDRDDGERRHFLSAASLISPSPDIPKTSIDLPIGQAVFSYARVADVIARISSHPSRDLQELFARMTFNVLVHNVDDHLKNTGFLRDPGTAEHYRLSPLFDVVTQEASSKHLLRIGKMGRESTIENVLSDVKRMRIKPATAQAIVNKALAVVAKRRDYYRLAGLSAKEIVSVERCMLWERSPGWLELAQIEKHSNPFDREPDERDAQAGPAMSHS